MNDRKPKHKQKEKEKINKEQMQIACVHRKKIANNI